MAGRGQGVNRSRGEGQGVSGSRGEGADGEQVKPVSDGAHWRLLAAGATCWTTGLDRPAGQSHIDWTDLQDKAI